MGNFEVYDRPRFSIRHWALSDRPREKMLAKDPGAETDAELLYIVIGSGSGEMSAVELSRRMLRA
ncbi:MAG: hypothetical protein K2H70_02270 [Bacteroidales bacterium]|nr:hypothetical protein [Bacteroidales bacterium]